MKLLNLSMLSLLLVSSTVSAVSDKTIADVRGTRPIEIHSEAGGGTPTRVMSPAEFKSGCLNTPVKVIKEHTDPARGPYLQISCNSELVWVRAFQMQLQTAGAAKVKCSEVVVKDAQKGQKITETGGGRGLGGSVCGDK